MKSRNSNQVRLFLALLALLALAPLTQGQTNRPSGSVVVWGNNVNSYGLRDVPVAAQSGVVAVAAEWQHIMALRSDGSVLAWGRNDFGETDVPSEAQSGVVAIAMGQFHSMALKSDGSVVAWGRNDSGPPANLYGVTDVPNEAQSGVVAIAAGANFSLALKNDGTVVAWGDNLYGQVTGTAITGPPRCAVAAPVRLGAFPLSGVTAIAAGAMHSVALKDDGSVVAWGWNSDGQINVPYAAKSGVVAIAAGDIHTLALKNDGSVLAWGSNWTGQTSVPDAARSGVVAIAAGGIAGCGHSVALKSDGSVVAWGTSYEEEAPADLPPALALAVGSFFTVALVREPAPSLTLLRNTDQTLSLSWSGAGVLEQTESLTSPDWQPAPTQDNPHTISTMDPMKFFRVKAN